MSGNVPIDTRANTAKELRKLRARRLARRMLLGVVLPTVLASIYYGGIVTPQFESVSSFTIQSAEGAGPSAGLEWLVSAVPGSSGTRDAMLVQEYILSRDMLKLLVDEHGYRDHYGADKIDVFSRLSSEDSLEETYEHFQAMVRVEHDSQSGALTLRVRAFDAETAHRMSEAILEASEAMVNRMSDQVRQDRMAIAQREVDGAETRLTKARQAIVELQGQREELNPQQSAAAVLSVRSTLEAELASARAELAAQRAILQPNAPQLVDLRRRVGALQAQVNRQRNRLAGTGDDDGLHETIAAFEPAVAEKEFAQRAYESALTSLELARVDADRQHRYLVTIATPSEPDFASYPQFWRSVLTVLLLAFALLGIGTLLLASIREHANV